jgi:hypothetical protein
MQSEREITTEIFRLIRQAISPLANIHGPLFAGMFVFGKLRGPVFLTETANWLWMPERLSQLNPQDAGLDDARFSAALDVFTLLDNLLESAMNSLETLRRHLGGIRNTSSSLTDVGLYLINPEARTREIVQREGTARYSQPRPKLGEPSIDDVLSDFAASNWIKRALRTALDRDPVDAANDAEVLAKLLNARCLQS